MPAIPNGFVSDFRFFSDASKIIGDEIAASFRRMASELLAMTERGEMALFPIC
jgi:hypothetical protein